MDDNPAFEADAVDRFLASRFPAAPDDFFSQELRRQTTRVLRRRLRVKQAGLVAALVFCYLAGVGTAGLAALPLGRAPEMAQRDAGPADAKKDLPPPPALAPPGGADAPLPLEQDPNVPAVVFERVAAAVSAEMRSRFYRRAGDRYLEDEDTFSALRCYARSLDAGSQVELLISPEDNWLLIALKKARQEEKSHAKTDS